MNTLQALISLNLIPQIGSVCLKKLLEYFQKPEDIFNAAVRDLNAIVGQNLGTSITSFDLRHTEKDLFLAKKFGVKIITLLDQDYPYILKEIPGPPIVLYVLGDISKQDDLAIGIVGSRRASFYGLNASEKFAAKLSSYGITIVSGMARGVDTYAHRGALKAGGRTIAVMGSGFCNIYPAENADLAKEISCCGAVISEFPMQAMPLAVNFPRRNRLISGLSKGILVTEAAKNSGALITADFALEQGREVFALPGRIDCCNSMGVNTLIKQGAKLVTCCNDILEELDIADISAKEVNMETDKPKVSEEKDEDKIFKHIGQQAISIDDLIGKTSVPINRISSLILKLQFKKLIRELPGKHFIRNN